MLANVVIGTVLALSAPGAAHADRDELRLRLNTFTMSAQSEVGLDASVDGRIATVWSSRRQQAGTYGIYARWWTEHGDPLTGEVQVNRLTAGHQTSPAVIFGRDGTTWCAWRSHGQDGDGGAVIARRFDRHGAGGPEVLVNEATAGDQGAPVLAATPDGGVLVAFTTRKPGASMPGIAVRRLRADGSPLGPETDLAHETAPFGRVPAIAAGPAGTIAVAWSAFDRSGRPAGIWTALLDVDGAVLREAERADRGLPGVEPVLECTEDGFTAAFLVPTRAGHDAVTVRLDAGACPTDRDPVDLGAVGSLGLARHPDGVIVAGCTGDGRVRWMTCGATRNEWQALNDEDPPPTAALRAGSAVRRLAVTPSGAIAIAWHGDGGLGDRSGAHVSLLRPTDRAAASSRTELVMAAAPATPEADAAAPHEPPRRARGAVGRGPRSIEALDDAIGFDGVQNTGWTPPDPSLAVGPDHVVQVTNGALAFFLKDGTFLEQQALEGVDGVWGDLGTLDFVFDPEALYDPHSERFFVMASEGFTPDSKARLLLAVSDDENPVGAWFTYRIDVSDVGLSLFDSPNMAVDETALYVTGDPANGSWTIQIWEKAGLLDGSSATRVNAVGVPTSSQSAGPPSVVNGAGAMYWVEHEEGFGDTVRLIAVRNPLDSPMVDTITLDVEPYSFPEDPPQQGTFSRPDTFDARLWSVDFAGDSIWATHHVNSSSVRARWYEISLRGWPVTGAEPTVVQWGEIAPGNGVRTFFPAIAADAEGNAMLTFSRSSSSEFISMATAMRAATDPPGTFRPMVIERTNSGPYTLFGRWGDYASVRRDPSDPTLLWALHEYAVGNDWRTWIVGRSVPAVSGDLDGDGVVDGADLGALLGNWGGQGIGDLDGNGEVDGADVGILLGLWSS